MTVRFQASERGSTCLLGEARRTRTKQKMTMRLLVGGMNQTEAGMSSYKMAHRQELLPRRTSELSTSAEIPPPML